MARLKVLVQPRASKTVVVGIHGDSIKIRIAAPPVDGAANEELIRFLAERLGVPRSAVTITSGQTGRRKVVNVDGITAAEAAQRLQVGKG
jgi:uncharacterized protein (TIGR00251 family)